MSEKLLKYELSKIDSDSISNTLDAMRLNARVKSEVNEIIMAWENSRDISFNGAENFRILAEFNNVVLAARDDTAYGRGLYYTTWQYSYDRTGFDHGHYTDDYNRAKEDFAVRAGLVDRNNMIPESERRTESETEHNNYEKSGKDSLLVGLEQKKKEVKSPEFQANKKSKNTEIGGD